MKVGDTKFVMAKNKNFMWASIGAVFLLIGGYFVNNSARFSGEDLAQLQFGQLVCEFFADRYLDDNKDALFINTSHDRELVVKYDTTDKRRLGNAAITDREKLYRVLKTLKDSCEYKYIILDVLFDADEKTDADSLLFPLIESMRSIVTVREEGVRVPLGLEAKSAPAIHVGLRGHEDRIRFEYIGKDGVKSLPLKAYEELYPDSKIESVRPLYMSGKKLCYKASFILDDSRNFSQYPESKPGTYIAASEPNWLNLGADLLEESDGSNKIVEHSRGRYVIIGDLSEEGTDMHGMYMRGKPGALILYRAIKALEDDKHVVHVPWLIYWWIIFTAILWFIVSGKNIVDMIPDRIKESAVGVRLSRLKPLRFLVESLGYYFILCVCFLVEYIIAQRVYSIALPSFAFLLVKFVVDYKKQ